MIKIRFLFLDESTFYYKPHKFKRWICGSKKSNYRKLFRNKKGKNLKYNVFFGLKINGTLNQRKFKKSNIN